MILPQVHKPATNHPTSPMSLKSIVLFQTQGRPSTGDIAPMSFLRLVENFNNLSCFSTEEDHTPEDEENNHDPDNGKTQHVGKGHDDTMMCKNCAHHVGEALP